MSIRVMGNNTPSGREAGRQLGRELRKLREDAGLTQSDIAEQLGCGQAKINKLENSLSRVSGDDLEKLLKIYSVSADHAKNLRDLAMNQPPRRSVGSPPMWPAYEELTDRELDARAIFSWHSEGIPVPLCSEPYMLQRMNNHPMAPGCVTELLRRREARAKVLSDEAEVDYQVVLSESALRRMPGGYQPEVVIEQMEHMIALVENGRRLRLHILPFDAPLDFVDSAFVLVRFPPEADEKDFVYLEYVSGARNIRKASEVVSFEIHWRRLRDAALSPADSVEFMGSIADRARSDPGIL